MLLTRALPPPFLLPSWGARQLALKVQSAFISDSTAGKASKGRRIKPRQRQSKPPGLSLFDELFPEEKATEKVEDEIKVDKLPPFQFDTSLEKAWGQIGERIPATDGRWTIMNNDKIGKKPRPIPPDEQEDQERRREAAVLVLNGASKRLEESDFFRVGHKGTHIQGWTTGIIKVIQLRDERTLEPLGSYFILFSSDGAARGYLDQTIRLHRLSKSYTGSLIASTLPPPPGLVRDGEDPNKSVKSFTLVPGQGRLSLRMINRPYKPGTLRILSEGGTHGISARQNKGEGLVLFSLDVGAVRSHELRDIIGLDGKRRNLHWMLADDAIIQVEEKRELNKDRETTADAIHSNAFSRGPSKYMIAFKDRNEARRFVREWHRRPLPFKRERSLGDEAPPRVNAQILW